MSFPSKGRDIRSEWLCVYACACVYVPMYMYPWCSLCVDIPRFYPHGLQSSGKPLTYCVSFPLKILKLADLFSACVSPWDSWASLHWLVFLRPSFIVLDIHFGYRSLHLTLLLSNPSLLPIKHSCIFSGCAPLPDY